MDKATPNARALLLAAALLLATTAAQACDGKSYSFNMQAGTVVEGGGLAVRLDKAKFVNDTPDKYYISVKDEGVVLADHVMLAQYDSLNFKTRCGTLAIGADRKFSFSAKLVALNWSYF